MLEGIHAWIILEWRHVIRVDVAIQLQELVVEILVGDRGLRTERTRLIPRPSAEHAIRLHQVLFHLVVHYVRLGELFVFEDFRLSLVPSLPIVITVLTIETVWVIFLFRYFYEEVVLGSGSSGNRATAAAESDFVRRPSVLAFESAAAFD